MNELRNLRTRRLMHVDEQRASAQLVELFHGGSMKLGFYGRSLLLRREPAHYQGTQLECSQRHPVLWVGDGEDEEWGVEEIVQTSTSQQRHDCCLPESAKDRNTNHD